jgi:Na+/proline symporter
MVFIAADYLAIAIYVAILIIIGYITSRKQSSESFLIADRKLTTLSGMATINATKTGAILLIFVALLYTYGFSAMWYFIGIITGYLVFLPFAVKLHKKSKGSYYTLANYFRHNYGKSTSNFASVINMTTMLGFYTANLMAASLVFEFFTGISFALSSIIIATVILTYLILAGFKAVVRTDLFQYLAIIFILTAFMFVLAPGVSIPATEWSLFSADISFVLAAFIMGIMFPFASPDLWQRVYAMPNIKTLKKSILSSVGLYLFVAAVVAVVGLVIKTQLPLLNPNIALVEGFVRLLPVGLSGLAVVVFFSAFMSSLDTYVYTASAALVHDFFGQLNKEQTVKAIRKAMFLLTIPATILSIAIGDIIDISFIFVAFVIILAFPVICTWVKPSIKSRTLNTMFAFSFVLLVSLVIIDFIQGTLNELIVLKALGLSMAGLVIGSVYSKIKAS